MVGEILRSMLITFFTFLLYNNLYVLPILRKLLALFLLHFAAIVFRHYMIFTCSPFKVLLGVVLLFSSLSNISEMTLSYNFVFRELGIRPEVTN